MKILLLLVANIILVSCVSVELETDYDGLHSIYDLYDFKHNCTKPGKMCKSCEDLVLCIQSEGTFEETLLQKCDPKEDEYCLIDKCSKDPNPLCSTGGEGDFQCKATGMFPDPYNCNVYHICSKKSEKVNQNIEYDNDDYYHNAMKCDVDYGYDPVSTYCKTPLKNNACPDTLPVPVCKNLGQTGALKNPSIYYICKSGSSDTLVPELHLCPHGKRYVGNKCY